MEFIGWIGSILLAFCGLPQAIECFKKGNAKGINWQFLMMWLSGELFTIVYVFPKNDWPLMFNYSINVICISVIVWFKMRPRPESDERLVFPPIPKV